MESTMKIYPSVKECKTNNMVKCTEEGCQSVFSSESNLALHLTKTHKKNLLQTQSGLSKHYYCPDLDCIYHTAKYFKNMKFLRQHYLKVHTKKDVACNLCQKTFTSESFLRSHLEYCGIVFNCCDCEAYYECYETLKTHCRRKKHNILVKKCYKSKVKVSKSDSTVVIPSNNRFILPKPCSSVPVVAVSSNNTKECQTKYVQPKLKSKMTQVNRDTVTLVSQNTQQTQTGSKNILLTVETQTIGDFIVNFNKKASMVIVEEPGNQKTAKTQTDTVESKTTSCNTSFNLEEFDFLVKADIEKSSSSTQTNIEHQDIYSTSTNTHGTIHTDTSDLLTDSLTNFDSNFFNCNTETQTDFMLEDDLFNCDYYSNMYTQTCDDILSGLGFNNIQTQTVFDDMLRSVESQTMMSRTKNVPSCKDMANMETQTDTEFRQMLEIINS